MNNSIKNEYLHLTEELNALDYLEKAHCFISQLDNDPIAWKWVILSIHQAMYGFAICALKGTAASLTVMYLTCPHCHNRFTDENSYITQKFLCPKCKKKFKGCAKLISFPEAMERSQNKDYMNMLITSKTLKLSDDQKFSIEMMHKKFRNNFIHYSPKGWMVELSGMSKIIIDCLDVIKFLALKTGNYTNLESGQKEKVEKIVEEITQILNKNESHERVKNDNIKTL